MSNAKRGRPPATGKRRDHRVVARLDAEEAEVLRDLCAAMDMPPSDVVRWALEYLRTDFRYREKRAAAAYFAEGLEAPFLHESGAGAEVIPQGGGEWRRQVPVIGAAPMDLVAATAKVHGRIQRLSKETATKGWDDEGGEPITERQWDDARTIASRALLELLEIPAPFVSACGDGTAHLQWTNGAGDRGVLEIGRNKTWWSFLSMSGEGDEVVEIRSPDEAFAKIRALFG